MYWDRRHRHHPARIHNHPVSQKKAPHFFRMPPFSHPPHTLPDTHHFQCHLYTHQRSPEHPRPPAQSSAQQSALPSAYRHRRSVQSLTQSDCASAHSPPPASYSHSQSPPVGMQVPLPSGHAQVPGMLPYKNCPSVSKPLCHSPPHRRKTHRHPRRSDPHPGNRVRSPSRSVPWKWYL